MINLNCDPVSPGFSSNASRACEADKSGNIDNTSPNVSTRLSPKVVIPAPVNVLPGVTSTNPNSSFGATTMPVSSPIVSNGLKSPITIGGADSGTVPNVVVINGS